MTDKRKDEMPMDKYTAIKKRLEYTLDFDCSGLAEAICDLPEVNEDLKRGAELALMLYDAQKEIEKLKSDLSPPLPDDVAEAIDDVSNYRDEIPTFAWSAIETLIRAAGTPSAEKVNGLLSALKEIVNGENERTAAHIVAKEALAAYKGYDQ